MVIDSSDQFLYVSSEVIQSTTSTTAANAFHTLKVNSDGTLSEPFAYSASDWRFGAGTRPGDHGNRSEVGVLFYRVWAEVAQTLCCSQTWCRTRNKHARP